MPETINAPRSPMLQRLYEERQTAIEFVDQTIAGANQEGQTRDLSQSEQETLTRTRERITALDAQIEPLEEFEQLRSAGDHATHIYRPAAPAGDQTGLGAQTSPRGHEYRSAGQIIVDRLMAAPRERGGMDDTGARDRLLGAGVHVPGETRAVADQTTADSLGVLPEPIIGAIVNNIDDRRPFITSVGARDLGGIPGKVFSRPVITQHVLVGEQLTEKTELASQKMIIGSVDFSKKTYGGVVDISRQDIDWTSPSAWDALLSDLQSVYAKTTENAAADAFAAAIVASVEREGAIGSAGTFEQWATALYAAAVLAYSGVEELPNHMWMSLNMWAQLGPVIDQYRRTTGGDGRQTVGTSSPTNFAGDVLDFPRTVVPSFPDDTLIVGVKEKTEFYEQRLGFLQAVEPSLLGVQVAYGGYAAFGTLDVDGFAKVVNLLA